jgi:hypothetical protein
MDIISRADLQNPPEFFIKVYSQAGNVFRGLQSLVMDTAKWKNKMEKDEPKLLFKNQKILLEKFNN